MHDHRHRDLEIILKILEYLQRLEADAAEISLGIVQYLLQREGRENDDNQQIELIAKLLSKLSPEINIDTISNSQAIHLPEVKMGDNYEVGQAGAVGPGASAIGQNFTQVSSPQPNRIDLAALAEELCKVRATGRATATGGPDEDLALAELAKAEVAAREGDAPKAFSHLARAGRWALGIATAIGVPVAAKAIETAIGK